jgi:hypothetical protein
MKQLLFAALILVPACVSKPKVDRQIYQPSVLLLPPNSRITTTEGFYISDPQEIEVWHSQKRIADLEEKLSRF